MLTKRINPPILDDEVEKLGVEISTELEINEDIAFVKKLSEKRLEYFTIPFSHYLAIKHLNKEFYKPIGVGGLIESKDGFIITLQNEIVLSAAGITYKRDKQLSISYMGFCKVGPFSRDIVNENLFFELEEELGLLKEDVKMVDVKPFENEELLFIAYMKTNLDKETILRLSNTAIDRWEYEELLFIDESRLKNILGEMRPVLRKAVKTLLRW